MHAAGYGKRIIPEMTVGVSAVSVAATLAPGVFPLMPRIWRNKPDDLPPALPKLETKRLLS